MEQWDQDFVDMVSPGHVTFKKGGTGQLHFGCVEAELDWRFDVAGQGEKWEARNITSGDVYFCPSYMVGSGRSFEESGFLLKLRQINGYILTDMEEFPNVPRFMIPKEAVERWYESGRLGAGTKVSREKALKLVEALA